VKTNRRVRRGRRKTVLHGEKSQCPIANALDIIGDKWTLLIIRDMVLLNKSTYKQFSDSDEKIPTNILSDRLKRLQSFGLIEKTSYQTRPVRYDYKVTRKGRDLWRVLEAIATWSNTYIDGTNVPPPGFFQRFQND
jgi:DNA-binding HxlR family transcriptional regulator